MNKKHNGNAQAFLEGARDGVPIGAGYFAVAFSLGIVAKLAGLTPFQGYIASLLNTASAGEYALFTAMAAGQSYFEVVIISFVINARYLLMGAALSQKFDPKTPFYHRLLVGYGITDEIFGVSIAREGYVRPFYNYGAILVAVPSWALGTAIGIVAGNILPLRAVSALSVALYGMFLATIVPAAKKDKVVMLTVLASFVLSYLFGILPGVSSLSGGNRTIILTVLIAAVAAIIKPIEDEEEESHEQ